MHNLPKDTQFFDIVPEDKKVDERTNLEYFLKKHSVPVVEPVRNFVFNTPVSFSIEREIEWEELLAFLPVAKATDRLVLKVGGFGGSVHDGVRVIHAVEETKAQLELDLIAPVYSMHATFTLFLVKLLQRRNVARDKIIIRPLSFAMFHDMSTMTLGKVGEIKKNIDNTREWGKVIYEMTSEGLLTPKEIKAIGNGEDLYLGAEELNKRIDKYFGV